MLHLLLAAQVSELDDSKGRAKQPKDCMMLVLMGFL
jgi:hypothetical protein